jgi:uncharacterized membrane protein YgcG
VILNFCLIPSSMPKTFVCAVLLSPLAAWGTALAAVETIIPEQQGVVSDYTTPIRSRFGLTPAALTDLGKLQLRFLSEDLESELGCHIVTVVVDSLDGESIEDFARRVFPAWKLDQAAGGRAVLVVAVLAGHKLYIEVGDGLKSTLSDSLRSGIVEKVETAKLSDAEYDGGLAMCARLIGDSVRGRFQTWMKSLRADASVAGKFIFVIAFTYVTMRVYARWRPYSYWRTSWSDEMRKQFRKR